MLARDNYDSAFRRARDDNHDAAADDELVSATRRYDNTLKAAFRISQLFRANEEYPSDVARQNEIYELKASFDNRNSADAMYDGGRIRRRSKSKTQGRRRYKTQRRHARASRRTFR